VVFLDEAPGDLVRQARDAAQQLQRELTALKRLIKRLEATTALAGGPAAAKLLGSRATPGSGTNGSTPQGSPPAVRIPPRAARSSLTTVLLARGRARQHPAPPSRT
jgi:hypothetical protein